MSKIWKLIKNFMLNQYTDFKYIVRLFYFYKRFINETITISGTGVMIILKKNIVIKIPLGKYSKKELINEYDNYLLMKNDELLKKYVDYKLKRKDDIYIMDRLYSVKNINYENILKDLNKLRSNNFDKNLNLSLCNLNKWCNIDFKYEFHYERCVMHGDFTPLNIMLNKKRQYVMIDLNRFTFNGVKGVDKIHFEIEDECKKRYIDFFDWININFDKFPDKNILFLYFVYRINAEHYPGVKLSKMYYKKVCNVYRKFKEFFS